MSVQQNETESITLSEMACQCLAEARRIDMIQSDMVAVGIRTAPSATQMHRMHVFERIVTVLDGLRMHPAIANELKEAMTRKGKVDAR